MIILNFWLRMIDSQQMERVLEKASKSHKKRVEVSLAYFSSSHSFRIIQYLTIFISLDTILLFSLYDSKSPVLTLMNFFSVRRLVIL